MSEQNQNIRPTKKQQELLVFITNFIAEHGYSPSYREIMHGCDYTSVATVALHVNNLITRGHLLKRAHNARSLEVVSPPAEAAPSRGPATVASSAADTAGRAWLLAQAHACVQACANQKHSSATARSHACVLLEAAMMLGCDPLEVAALRAQL